MKVVNGNTIIGLKFLPIRPTVVSFPQLYLPLFARTWKFAVNHGRARHIRIFI